MKLESVIQSEVSQKEKNKFVYSHTYTHTHIHTHMKSRKMVLMNIFEA